MYQLGEPSIWVDELNHVYVAQSLNETGRPELPSGELYPRAQIYSELVAVSYRTFGVNEFSSRLPSALIGILCIAVIFFVTDRCFGRIPALLAALFAAISPFAIGWSRLSRMYTLFQFFYLLAIYAFYRGFEHKGEGPLSKLQERLLSGLRLNALQRWMKQWRLNMFWLLLAAVLFLLSYLTHQLTALFAVGLILYLGLMFLITWHEQGVPTALRSKYFILFSTASGVMLGALLLLPQLRSFADYAVSYLPKWAAMPRFQDPKLYLDFLFDTYTFPMAVLFIIGALQVIVAKHRFGVYLLSLFTACFLMFTFVFSYRHLQYLYNVYAILIILSAFGFSNIILSVVSEFKSNWAGRLNWSDATTKGILVCLFLIWLPFAPSVRLAKSIPFVTGDGFNGAVFLTELRKACDYIEANRRPNDLIVSSDALGTMFYLGAVDYNINFSDRDLAKEKDLRNQEGKLIDFYTGAPFIEDVEHLQALMQRDRRIWLVSESYKFYRAPVYIPVPLRQTIMQNFEKAFTSAGESMVVYLFPNREAGPTGTNGQSNHN